jgi:hypothetical protein
VLNAFDSRKPLLLPGDSTTSSTVQLDSTDTKWRAYSKGSLGAQSTSALCGRLLSAMLLVPTYLAAQRLTPVPSYAVSTPASLFRLARLDGTPLSKEIPRTYWLEGAIIGGASVGVLSALYFRGLGESGDRTAGTIAGFVLGGVVGFTGGALIGGQFRKSSHTRP